MTTDPLDQDHLLQLGRQALDRLDFSGAVEILFKAKATPARDVLLARAYRNTARPRDVEKLLVPLVESNPDAATELGMLRLILGGHDEARTLFERALSLSDDFQYHLDAVHGLAYLDEIHSDDRAIVYTRLRDALKRYPDNTILLQTLGIAHLNDGAIDEARALFEKVIELRSKAPFAGTRFQVEAHGNLACALVKAADHDAALDQVEMAMQCCPRWLRQGMAMSMERDPDLEPLHSRVEFQASLRMRDDTSRQERIARIEAERATVPARLPDPASLHVELTSGDPTRVAAACEIAQGLLSDREEIWEDHGWCDPGVRTCAEEVIKTSLQDATWLERAALADGSRPTIELIALLTGSHDQSLRALGGPIALKVLEHWLPQTGGYTVMPILEILAFDADPTFNEPIHLPAVRPLLVAAACNADTDTNVRNTALEALALLGKAEDAAALVPLVDVEEVATQAVQTIHALDASQLDPARLLTIPTTRYQTAVTYAETLGIEHLDTLIDVVAEQDEWWQREQLLRQLFGFADQRLIPQVFKQFEAPHAEHWCLAWMRTQQLSQEQLTQLMAYPLTEKRAAHWLADVARNQKGRLSFNGEVHRLPNPDTPPDEGTAKLVAYLGLRDRLPWIRANIAAAGRRTVAGIVVALGALGDDSDLAVLEQVGGQVSWLQRDALVARAMITDDLDLLNTLEPRSLFALWALERLADEHGMQPAIRGAVQRANERGLHNADLNEFRRVVARLVKL